MDATEGFSLSGLRPDSVTPKAWIGTALALSRAVASRCDCRLLEETTFGALVRMSGQAGQKFGVGLEVPG